MRQLPLHPGIGVLAFKGKALAQGSIEAEMGFMGEPDEVGSSIVGVVTVKMVALIVAANIFSGGAKQLN